MSGIEAGMVCYKTSGRHAGQKFVILSVDKSKCMAVVQGEKTKEKKCSLHHLLPSSEKVDAGEFRAGIAVPKKKTREKKPQLKKHEIRKAVKEKKK